jgi:hypothetical protein
MTVDRRDLSLHDLMLLRELFDEVEEWLSR